MSAPFTVFPAINATLNGTSAILLLTGRRLIAQRKIQQHRAVMIAAVISSSLFLACYLTYHALLQIYAHGAFTRFQGTGLSRPIYFSILLSHTPEIYDRAAGAGFDLMLSGHTHGGQLCLPGGIPIRLEAKLPRSMAAGLWRHGEMVGYTTRGVGTSLLPVRLNCPPEITLHALRRPKLHRI